MGEETSNSTQNKTRTKTTRPKAVYQWTVSDVQKWYRRHCGEYSQYEQLFAQVGDVILVPDPPTYRF